ncbi:uncharacterized protein TRAVEDRAFT_46404 [Trametes versicolor FP-101664 SS1]|uniref:uncharacterized protein n=1 Tax=Trametes versicolor (strain FP-101664) TaxID=717944 RepID=UPI00046242D5|nr:uncharacterized protein TRAVEDRAFT_46404 [Trametes versicolor FP-101664 SS1]EIW59093.1 hypothetical protein TRAVEDRAFT_46404 [Trametes versicolor FP-101664 SS1]
MSTTSEDFAATLRAAALMTLKSKRRKPTVVKAEPVSIRSLAEPPSIELDYGQEEPTGTSSIASSPVIPPATAVAHARSASRAMDVDEGAYREEGEISDSEMASAMPQTKVEPQSPVLHKASPVVLQTQVEPREPVALPTANMAAAPLLLPHEIFAIPQAPALVDENHARPGLAMTQAQYEAAKDIVLDLLGWGVPPEYLVSCGLSREIVFYVFVELNLRLPSNLDTTGLPIVPVPPSASLPEPVSAADVSRTNISHPSLPPKPQPPTEMQSIDLNASHTLSAEAPPFVSSASESAITSVASSSGTNLHDMEQQRRQELLARKAVLASRKSKKKAMPSAVTASPFDGGSNSKASSLVPTKMVDDFLQSIEPVALAGSSSLSTGSVPPSTLPARPHSMYDMDVDDVPGLTTGAGLITEYTPLSRPPPTSSVSVFNPISPRSPAVLESAIPSTSEFASNPPSSTATTNSFNTTPLSYGGGDDDMDAIPGLFQPHTFAGDDKPLNSRRGTKRPVAADFVDLEPGPSKLAKGIPDFFRANIRRKTAGFAGLTQRRCVIDLSDSEGDDNESTGPGGFPQWTDPRASQVVTPQATAAPTPRIRSPIITSSIAPSVLQEKEEAIRRMRELIAQREESRKKKIEVPSRSTPSSSSTPTNGTVVIKQEDDEFAGIRSFDPSRSSSSSTPDRTSNGRPYDSQDEQSVLATLLPHDEPKRYNLAPWFNLDKQCHDSDWSSSLRNVLHGLA